jgi:hypothetical protein
MGHAGQGEERRGKVFPGVEGAPLTEPFVVRKLSDPGGWHGFDGHHSDLIVSIGLNDSWMSRTLVESKMYRSGCSRQMAARQQPQSARNRHLTAIPRSTLT